ncbi:MAG: hypothetical protein KAT77_04255 [Nanoarchaeota archaeon]|nr:hypothetical protein [Nanoarchaeota archaeon]
MNKKILVWTQKNQRFLVPTKRLAFLMVIAILVLTSLAFAAIEQERPGLISVEEGDPGKFISEVEKNANPVLDNEEKITLMSLDSWLADLTLTPPGGAARKKANLAAELDKYFSKYKLTVEEQAIVLGLTEDEQSYLVASLGRSRGKKAMIVYWMLRHSMFKYILYHENFHTFTTEKINLYNQLDIEQKKGGANDSNQTLFVSLWLEYVGDEKEVFFSRYGQTNQYESFSEFFARLYTGYFAKDLSEMDWAKDAKQTRSYIAAFIIADCFELFDTYDASTGLAVKKKVESVIFNDGNKKAIYDELKVMIEGDAGGCPVVLETLSVEGSVYKCGYRAKGGDVKVDSCELVELPEPVNVGGDTFVGRYDANGNFIGSTSVVTGQHVITETDRSNVNELEELPEFDYEEYSEGEVVIPADGSIVEFLTPESADEFQDSGLVNLDRAVQDGLHRVEVETEDVILAIEEVAVGYGIDLLVVVDDRELDGQIALEGFGKVMTLSTPASFWNVEIVSGSLGLTGAAVASQQYRQEDVERVAEAVRELLEFKTDAEYENFVEKVWALLSARTPSGYEEFMRLSAQILNQLDENNRNLRDISRGLDNILLSLGPENLIWLKLGQVLDALDSRGEALDSLSQSLDKFKLEGEEPRGRLLIIS